MYIHIKLISIPYAGKLSMWARVELDGAILVIAVGPQT